MDQTPPIRLMQLMSGYRCSQAIYVAAKLGIADILGDGARPSREVAEATQSHPPTMRRLLRMLATLGLFEENPQDHFRSTPIGVLLRGDVPGSMRTLVLFLCGEEGWRAWGALLHSVRTGEPAFEHVFGMHAFDYYAQFPERERSQAHEEAMAILTAQSDAAILRAYDFSQFRTLVDVGGGNGTLLASILKLHANLRGILFDLPHVVATSEEVLRKSGVVDRCSVIAGSFFESIPKNADGYLMKRIIHDWDDTRAVAILTQCRRAMEAPARLLILDEVMPERASPADVSSFMLDMEMLIVAPGGRERTEEEFRRLLAAAGVRLTRVIPTGHMRLGIVEAVPA